MQARISNNFHILQLILSLQYPCPVSYNPYREGELRRNLVGCQETSASCSMHKADFLELKHQRMP